MAENVEVRTVEHGEASDLPEVNWLWRRWFAFTFTLGCVVFAWRVSERVTDITTLRMIARYALGLAGLMCLLYMAGASTEAITKLFAAVRTTRKETVTTAPPPAAVTTTAAGTTVEAADDAPAPLPPSAQVPR